MLNEACGLLVLSRHVAGVTVKNCGKHSSGWPASRWRCETSIFRIEIWKVFYPAPSTFVKPLVRQVGDA